MVAALRQPSFTFTPLRPSRLEQIVGPVVAVVLLIVTAMVVKLAASPPELVEGIGVGDFSESLSAAAIRMPTDLPPAWVPQPSADISETARAVRIGARIIDVELAAQVQNAWMEPAYDGDIGAGVQARRAAPVVAAYAGELSALLAEAPAEDYAASLYAYVMTQAQLVATPEFNSMRWGRKAAVAFHPYHVALGNWLEAARVAAAHGDREFFDTPASRIEAAALTAIPNVSTSAHQALARVRMLMPNGRAGNLAVLERALTNALRALANQPARTSRF